VRSRLVALAVVAALRAPAFGASTLERGGDAHAFAHCTLAGESRPASTCATPVLLATHKGRRVPRDGRLTVALPPQTPPLGGVVVEVEAYVYERAPETKLIRGAMKHLQAILAQAHQQGVLGDLVGPSERVRRVAQPPTISGAGPPGTITIALAPTDAGKRVAYAAWAWRLASADVEIDLGAVAAGTRVTLAAGAQDVSTIGMPAVGMTAELIDATSNVPLAAIWQRTLDPVHVDADRGWQETTVDLTPWAGPARRLALHALGAGTDVAAHFGTWARPLVRRPAAAPDTRPSVLLLSIDTLRADHVGAYGQSRPTTPNLDRLAATSALFERVYSAFPSTTGSHMSMLTSLLPCAHGVTVPNGKLAPAIPTLAELLAGRGYATVGITEDGLIKGVAGFNRGFDRYRDLRPDPPPNLGDFHVGIDLAKRWLEAREPGEPFFMFLHTYQVHIPYKIPPHLTGLFTAPADAVEWQRHMADYDTGLRYADELLAGFLDFLQARGLLDEIVLVVTSDHGTEFGERGGIGHAKGVHTEQLHVPLLVRYPGVVSPRRVTDVAAVVDLPPTILELVGLTPLPTFTGRSLVPQLRGEPGPEREIVGEQLWGPRQTSLRDGRHTWITTETGTALYEDATDRWEQRDRAADEPDLAARGRDAIVAFRARCQTEMRELSKAPVPMDPDRLRALKALGYVQ
jgi:arylsulfatase A-like enzyme